MNPYETNPDLAVPVGRDSELSTLRALLDRPAPAHVSVVGPRSIGKTLLLRALVGQAASWDRFTAVAPWDIRRHTPKTDTEFFAGLAGALAEALHVVNPDLAELLVEDPKLDVVQEVFGEFEREGQRALVVVDHLDRALRQPDISKDLWDNLRDLTVRGALVLVTATSQRLRELASADSRTSEFWNVFAAPVELGPFSEVGVGTFLAPLETQRGPLSTPVRKEFDRQTGGVPVLCALVARSLYDGPAGGIEKATVTEVAAHAAESDQAASLWDDLSAPAKGLLVEVAGRGDAGVPVTDVPRGLLADLQRRGYLRATSAGLVVSSARLVLNHAALHQASESDIARLFGPGADGEGHTRALLEYKLASVSSGPADVRNDMERAIRDLARPVRSLGALREAAHAALDAIWDANFPDRRLPQGTVDGWYRHGSQWAKKQATPLVERTGYKLPSGQGARASQENILKLLVDPSEYGEVSVTDGTCRLISALRELGNYGHHVADSGAEDVPFETAAAACTLGVELFRRLSVELPDAP